MAIKITGKDKDIERYRKILHDRGLNTKSGEVYDTKPEGYRLLQGTLSVRKSQSVKVDHGKNKEAIAGYNQDERMLITGVANAAIIDRMDEKLNPQGCDLKNYVKNPVLLADHMYFTRTAIGLVEEVRIEIDGVHFDAFVGDPTKAPLTDAQKEIRSLINQGILKTVSVGFIPKEIIAPEWDDNGRLIKPAIIDKWELLELSVVAVPCNPDATFEMRQYAKKVFSLNESNKDDNNTLTYHKNLNDNIKKQDGDSTKVRTLIFDKERFTVATAKEWAAEHDFKSDKVDETDNSIRLRQLEPDLFIDDSFRTIDLDKGIKAVIGRLKDEDAMDEKTARELIDGVKSIGTLLQTLNANAERNVQLSETILGHFESKGSKPKDDKMDDEEKPKEEEEEEESKSVTSDEIKSIKEWIESTKSELEQIKSDLTEVVKVIKLLADERAE